MFSKLDKNFLGKQVLKWDYYQRISDDNNIYNNWNSLLHNVLLQSRFRNHIAILPMSSDHNSYISDYFCAEDFLSTSIQRTKKAID